jgi:sirohydrochlorin ferrochelatase
MTCVLVAHGTRKPGGVALVGDLAELADRLFHDRLRASRADLVTEPLGTHPDVVRLIANRFRRARPAVAA